MASFLSSRPISARRSSGRAVKYVRWLLNRGNRRRPFWLAAPGSRAGFRGKRLPTGDVLVAGCRNDKNLRLLDQSGALTGGGARHRFAHTSLQLREKSRGSYLCAPSTFAWI